MVLEPNAIDILLEYATMLVDRDLDLGRARDLVFGRPRIPSPPRNSASTP